MKINLENTLKFLNIENKKRIIFKKTLTKVLKKNKNRIKKNIKYFRFLNLF
ncbi:hypothetical protein BaOVIS_034930 (apicoplast) [Babesia ovis]|uniref:Uncharacterized protein n=1 Tax=Babesia ovis TaxID=5869 RepID=A0A9W5TE00_BABOV|nr:hypothetical protein BaOVIS_034930 [Babesia ovis]